MNERLRTPNEGESPLRYFAKHELTLRTRLVGILHGIHHDISDLTSNADRLYIRVFVDGEQQIEQIAPGEKGCWKLC